MNFSANFIRRPIATSLLMLGIAVFGFMAYHALPVSDLAECRFPDHHRLGRPARRGSGYDGLRGRDAA